MDAELEMRTPCCKRKVRASAMMAFAVIHVHRTCPKCRVRWLVKIDPVPVVLQGMLVHVLTWTRL